MKSWKLIMNSTHFISDATSATTSKSGYMTECPEGKL